jgi:hypothetical protein
MHYRRSGGYGSAGKKKRGGIGEIENQNGFIIPHVHLEKRFPEKIKLFFFAYGMHSGQGMLLAKNVWPGGGMN